MQCPSCRYEYPKGDKFCHNCGAALPQFKKVEYVKPEFDTAARTENIYAPPQETPVTAQAPTQAVATAGNKARLVLGIIGAAFGLYFLTYASRIHTVSIFASAFGTDVRYVGGYMLFAAIWLLIGSVLTAATWKSKTGGIWSGVILILAGGFTFFMFTKSVQVFGFLYITAGLVVTIIAAYQGNKQ